MQGGLPQLSPPSARWKGVGDASCTLGGNLPGADSFNAMPNDVRCAMMQAVPPAAQDASAAISLAGSIDLGSVPSDAALIAAIGGIATITAGPVAGAAISAIGAGAVALSSALQGLFTALGLYSTPPPTYNYCGLQRLGIDQIPYGPGDTANWIDVDSYPDYENVVYGQGVPGGASMPGGRPPYSPNAQVLANPWQSSALGMLLYCVNAVPGSPYAAPTRFEEYVRVLMLKNLQYWLNCWPTVPPQDLLAAAQSVWNASHAPSPVLTYAPYENAPPASGPGQVQAPDGSWQPSLPSWILSGYGDPTGQMHAKAPITVNGGAPTTVSSNLAKGLTKQNLTSSSGAAAGMSTTGKIATGAAVVVGGGLAAAAIYAFVKKEALSTVLKKTWQKTGGRLHR